MEHYGFYELCNGDMTTGLVYENIGNDEKRVWIGKQYSARQTVATGDSILL